VVRGLKALVHSLQLALAGFIDRLGKAAVEGRVEQTFAEGDGHNGEADPNHRVGEDADHQKRHPQGKAAESGQANGPLAEFFQQER